ncbi:MAG TPA: hypothetical protein VIY86_04215, partial [Pirellulaceae bacterium]
ATAPEDAEHTLVRCPRYVPLAEQRLVPFDKVQGRPFSGRFGHGNGTSIRVKQRCGHRAHGADVAFPSNLVMSQIALDTGRFPRVTRPWRRLRRRSPIIVANTSSLLEGKNPADSR